MLTSLPGAKLSTYVRFEFSTAISQPVPLQVSYSACSGREPLAVNGVSFSCELDVFFYHPASSIKTLKICKCPAF